MTKHKGPLRRAILGTLALALLALPAAFSGCAAGFAPISQVSSLRVIAVTADNPYAQPGDPVHFQMYYDNPPSGGTPLIAWMGCYDPDGNQYYNCYPQLKAQLNALASGHIPPGAIGDTFTYTLPPDIISKRTPPPSSSTMPPSDPCIYDGAPIYGTAYVFFVVCNGTFGAVPPEGNGLAGSFPVGCFDSEGKRLDADNFVPGYTQVYAFCDTTITNKNPSFITDDGKPGNVNGIIVQALDANDDVVGDGGVGDAGTVTACNVSEASRNASGGCGRTDPYKACARYQITVDVPEDVAEIDPTTTDMTTHQRLHEIVWVDYFADQGDIDTPLLLVADAASGKLQRNDDGTDKFATRWVGPPPAPPDDGGADAGDGGVATQAVNIWAVLRDSRGGVAVAQRQLIVTPTASSP
jgi:hypothetical protein